MLIGGGDNGYGEQLPGTETTRLRVGRHACQGVAAMHRSREIKARLERLLRLESEPDFLDIVNHRVEHDFADFHRRRPLRGVVLDETFRRYWRLSDALHDGHLVEWMRWRLYEERQALRALTTARKLTYHAWTVGVEGYSVSMDGHLEMEGCTPHLTLDLHSMGAIEREARMAWERRNSVSTHIFSISLLKCSSASKVKNSATNRHASQNARRHHTVTKGAAR